MRYFTYFLVFYHSKDKTLFYAKMLLISLVVTFSFSKCELRIEAIADNIPSPPYSRMNKVTVIYAVCCLTKWRLAMFAKKVACSNYGAPL